MRKIEILAPAGSFEGLKAAVSASCDAVYIGGSRFGARAYADNPDEDTLLRAIDYAHIHNKKVYLTVNTLFKEHELENELYPYLIRYYEQGVDAVIVQDTGVMHYLHEYFPGLPIHASTQMSLTMAQGAEVLKCMGVTRLVNARELSLEEIKLLRENTELEIESFVHGALCYCYSGQCLMSSMFGGRSGNRGRCAQPCRMPYELKDGNRRLMKPEEKYLLSPKDICTLDMIPDLIDAGIDSFKIEGRMKRPEYAAGTSFLYRKYTDKYLELGRERYEAFIADHGKELEADGMLLKDLYNRGGFSKGYYASRNGKSMLSLLRPNHSGVYVGKVTAAKGGRAQIRLTEDLNPQDILEIREAAEAVYEFTVKNEVKKGSGYSVNFKQGLKIKPGDQVYRTRNNRMLKELEEGFFKEEPKEEITGELTVRTGERMRLELSLRDIRITVLGDTVQEAKSQPLTEDKLRRQFLKTNDTSFLFHELSVIIDGNVFVPVQKMNELRREGLNALSNAVLQPYRRALECGTGSLKDAGNMAPVSGKPGIAVQLGDERQLEAACGQAEVSAVYLESDMVPLSRLLTITGYVKSKDKKCYVVLPHIFRYATYQLFFRHKNILLDDTIDGYIIRNYEEYEFTENRLDCKARGKTVILDYGLYVMNRHSMQFWKEKGVSRFTAPVELNYRELKELAGMYQDIIAYGRTPLMVSAQCLAKTAYGDDRAPDGPGREPCPGIQSGMLELTDRYQKSLPVRRHCRDCYNTIYNSQCTSLLADYEDVIRLRPGNIRLVFTFESPGETEKIILAFVQAYLYDSPQDTAVKDFTRGHFRRGVE